MPAMVGPADLSRLNGRSGLRREKEQGRVVYMLTLDELKKRRIVMPDEEIPSRWEPGDIMTFNHGPRLPNVYAFEFLPEMDSMGHFRTRMLENEEHELLSPWIVKFLAREIKKQAAAAEALTRTIFKLCEPHVESRALTAYGDISMDERAVVLVRNVCDQLARRREQDKILREMPGDKLAGIPG